MSKDDPDIDIDKDVLDDNDGLGEEDGELAVEDPHEISHQEYLRLARHRLEEREERKRLREELDYLADIDEKSDEV